MTEPEFLPIIDEPPEDHGWFQREPVLTFLGGLAGVVEVILLALVGLEVIAWTPGQTAGVVAAVAGVATLLIATLRSIVVSPATDAKRTATALLTLPPGTFKTGGVVGGD